MSESKTRINLITWCAFLAALAPAGAPAQGQPDYYIVTAKIRDFRGMDDVGGHEDFQRHPVYGGGAADAIYRNVVEPTIGADGRPVWKSQGERINKNGSGYDQWTDVSGNPICHLMYGLAPGDQPGELEDPSKPLIFTNQTNFDMWYHDVPGVNISSAVQITMVHQGGGVFLFDSNLDPQYAPLGGFFPIDEDLFGNSPEAPTHNYHFTSHVRARFDYEFGAGKWLRFTGDDDLWIFIAGQLVIDLSGVHPAQEQYLDLDRLNGSLTHGQKYMMDIFHAERQTHGSNFRFETNLILEDIPPDVISVPYD